MNNIYQDTINWNRLALSFRSRKNIFKKDLLNKIKHGINAPLYNESILVDADKCKKAINDGVIRDLLNLSSIRDSSGLIIMAEEPFKNAMQVTEIPKIKFCHEHWVNKVPWKDTGAYDYMLKSVIKKGEHDGCKNFKDIIKRYEELDFIFDQVKKEGRLRTRKEMNPGNFRGSGEVIIHIGPDGEIYFEGEGGGNHRFAIAYILKILLPAQVGCIHKSAIQYLSQYRKRYII